MKTKAPLVLMIGLITYLFFGSCVWFVVKDDQSQMQFEDRQAYNLKIIEKLQLSQSKASIIELMGPPDITEAKKTQLGMAQVLFYRTHHIKKDGFTTQDECTSLLFINDKLVSWGHDSYQQYQQAS
ncbi:DUF3192 domain-containing protein [Algibacillus agarilyticus]|uniref:DUF3192 domain-containing protein n=1 Tax=Algibacillus agarilyticus TaxID=2234133 RepID=UPI00130046A3|nr:DUF3192 domain-containing protein [Algibacillus agarilyticus]